MKSADNFCLNCDTPLEDQLYCPTCGQKARLKNLSLKYFLSSFYVAFLDFDKKILRSLRDIWVPNKISADFLEGGRRTYVNHLRFFFICLAVTFSLIALNINRLDLDSNELQREAVLYKVLEDIEKLEKDSLEGYNEVFMDTLKSRLFSELSDNQDTTIVIERSGINISINQKDTDFHFDDLYNLEPDSLFRKYQIDGKFNQFLSKQGIKALKNGSSAINFWISNMLWGIILATVLMALVLMVLYFRHKAFYVEHLMQMINFHCILLIISSVLLAIDLFAELHTVCYLIGLFVSLCYLMISLKRYYSQSAIKTILKGSLILFAYMFVISIVLTMILGLSVIFF